jgi:hypothetical protein
MRINGDGEQASKIVSHNMKLSMRYLYQCMRLYKLCYFEHE